VSDILRLVWNAGTGLHFALLGLIAVALAELRLRRGLAVLPIHLKASSQQPSDTSLVRSDQPDWTKFVWFAITLMNPISLNAGVAAAFIVGGLFDFIYLRYAHSDPTWLLKILVLVVVPAVFLLVVLGFAGGQRWRVLRDSFRLPFPEYFAIALFLPVAIYSVPRILTAVHDPSRWLALPFGDTDPWLSPAFDLFNFFLVALVEEIAWRGYLQPRFIARFGLYRGVFFVGLVWAAFHFSSDFRASQTDANVIDMLFGRILGAILIGFVLSWLTLRSKSVLPAAVTHTAINGIGRASYWPALCLWALVAVLLFRFWPPRDVVSAPSERPLPKLGSPA
jgi:membrane protease YdiL (CAAX protease family)